MITFKAIIIPGNRRKDGTYPVNIRVTFKGKSRRLATTLVCTQADLTRTLKIKNATILNKSDALIARMRNAVNDLSPFDLENEDVDWVVRHIKDELSRETFHLDFFEWADRYLETKGAKTSLTYRSALNAFERFLGKREIDINAITRMTLLEFMDMVDNEKKMHYDAKTGKTVPSRSTKIPKAASTRHLAKLENIFNAAKDRYNDDDSDRILIPKSPFSKIAKIYPVSQGQSNLGHDLMQRIISAQVDNEATRTALDIFIVSFGLMGANLADLYYAKPFQGEWVYNRQKTMTRRADQAEMRVAIPDQLKPYIDRLKGNGGGWWLNELHRYASNKDSCTQRINRHLKKWCNDNGVEEFTFYSARHTFASLARKEGVDKSTIDDCLGHKGTFQVADIYADKAWDLIQETNRKVVETFIW